MASACRPRSPITARSRPPCAPATPATASNCWPTTSNGRTGASSPTSKDKNMARNTQVAADHNAPPITRILAEYVAQHPSRGWSDAVDHEAHRTFLNWLGCAVGAAKTEAAEAALAAVAELQPAPQATVADRSERVDMASAALVNGITSHTF